MKYQFRELYSIWCCFISSVVNNISGGTHKFTLLSELGKSLMEELDRLRDEACQMKSEADKLVKDTIAALKKWDTKTEELVSQLHKARDKHVSKSALYILKNMVLEEYQSCLS